MATMDSIPSELLDSFKQQLMAFYGQQQAKHAKRIEELRKELEHADKDVAAKLQAYQDAARKRDALRTELNELVASEEKIARQAEAAVRAALGAKAPRAPRSNGRSSEVHPVKYLVKYAKGDETLLRELHSNDGAITDYAWALNRVDPSVPKAKALFLDELQKRSGIRPFSAEHEEAPNKTLTAKFDKITVHVILL